MVSNKELTEKTKYTITGLTPGCKILVRVKAVNKAGASAPRSLQHSVLVKEVVGKFWEASFQSRNNINIGFFFNNSCLNKIM